MRANQSPLKMGQREQDPPGAGWQDLLSDGTPVLIRPVRKQDASLERAFLQHLSEQGRHDRFVGVVQAPSDAVAQHLTDVQREDQVALIAIVRRDGHDLEIGAGGYFITRDGKACHAAIAVDDAWRKLGVGTLLARHLIGMARASGIRHAFVVDPVVRGEHHRLAQSLGFRSRPDPEDPAATVFELQL
jgi:GNAT superfamily N-acetyltransferase